MNLGHGRDLADAQALRIQAKLMKGGAVAPPLFGAVKLLVNNWPAISELWNGSRNELALSTVSAAGVLVLTEPENDPWFFELPDEVAPLDVSAMMAVPYGVVIVLLPVIAG